MRYHHIFLVAAASAVTLSSCNVKDSAKTSAESAGPKSLAGKEYAEFTILGPHFFTLPSCDEAESYIADQTDVKEAKLAPAEYMFQLVLSNTDPKELKRSIKKYKLLAGTNNIDTSVPAVDANTYQPSRARAGKLDFDVDLVAHPDDAGVPTYSTARIEVVLKPDIGQSFSFIEADKAIRAGDENGRHMFCGLGVQGNKAYFTAYYFKQDNKDYGSFNIGVTVQEDGGAYENTVFYDPEVKNDG